MITLAEAEYPVPMSELQIQKKSRKASFTRKPHRTLWKLIYTCDLRMGETLTLSPADTNSYEDLSHIRRGKGKKDRRVPLSQRILEQLRRYYRSYTPPNEYLFEGQKGGQYRCRIMNIKGKTMAHNMPNGNVIGVKYAYINKLAVS